MAFFWFQSTGGEDVWREAVSTHRAKIIAEQSPAFTTVLDAHDAPDETWGRDEYAKMRYSGPFYADWDAEDVADAIKNFHLFLANLKDIGVDLNCLRLYATGGRGFHLEMPAPVFMAKIPKPGTTALPYIYREMAMELVVETLDMRVYTGRKGRMWRTPNVERSNGKFKVPLTLSEALEVTPESYAELTSEKRAEPHRSEPMLNPTMAAMFLKAQTKVDEAQKRRAKGGNADEALLAKFKGQFPPTLQKILSGEGLAPNVGFHKVAMQLAITANALGKTADQLVEAAGDLCKNYSGDSSRYGSPRKRKEELRRMWEYTHDNPCYSYSKGGIRSLLDVDVPSGDLEGMASYAGVGYVPDNDEEEDELPEDVAAEVNAAQMSLLEGLIVTKSGVHKRTAEGARTISNIGFSKPTQLMDLEDGKTLGLEVDVLCDGERKGRHVVPGRAFTSRSNLSAWCTDFGGIFSGTDTQAGAVQLMLSRSAKKGGRVVYALHKEGLDIVQNPLVKDRSQKDVVWVHPDKVVTYNEEANYVFQPLVARSPIFHADVHNARRIENTSDTVDWLNNLFNINSPLIVAQMLGWFVSCFHRQHYHQAYKQFPLLHPNGPAGSGKTMTTLLMAGMYYLTTEPVLRSCAPSTTPFTLKAAMTGSASIPVVLDEYKPMEMGQARTDLLTQAFRMAYNQGAGSSGGLSKGGANDSFRDVTEYTYSTPIAFLAESQEMQTAVAQRYIAVGFSPADTVRHTMEFNRAQAGVEHMPALGSLLLAASFQESVQSRREALDPVVRELRGAFDRSVHDRQVFNLAVVMAGLDFLDRCLRTVFGDIFRDQMMVLKQSLYDHKMEINAVAMSEAAKMMSDLSLITHAEAAESEFALREGEEYLIKDGYLDIRMKETFVKYFAWCKRKGFTPYYGTAEAFMSAMGKFSPTVDRLCLSSPLKKSGQTRVFRFKLDQLAAEGVEMFKCRALD